MDCNEKNLLVRKYKLYVRAHRGAVENLAAVSDGAARAEWELAWDLASRAHQLCQDVWAQLKAHTIEHGC
jgi:hypothetical protein